MNKLLYLSDDDVQSQLATKYNLLVHIGLATFQYAIIDIARDQVKVLAEFEIPVDTSPADLIKYIEQLPESKRQFKFSFNRVKISFYTADYTFIPSDLYLETDRLEYGKFLNSDVRSDFLVNNIPSAEIKSVIAIDSEFHSALNKIFQNPGIYAQAIPFLEGIQRILRRDEEQVYFMDIHPRHFQVAFFKDFKLEFYNSFDFATPDEFNYFLLNTIVSLEITLEQTPIYLSGRITKGDDVYQRIGKYFENVRFMGAEEPMKYSGESADLAPHTFFSLFSLDLCE